jgi:hypothetical protein
MCVGSSWVRIVVGRLTGRCEVLQSSGLVRVQLRRADETSKSIPFQTDRASSTRVGSMVAGVDGLESWNEVVAKGCLAINFGRGGKIDRDYAR